MEKLTVLELLEEEVNYFKEDTSEVVIVKDLSEEEEAFKQLMEHINHNGGATVDVNTSRPMDIEHGYGVAVEVNGLTAVKPMNEYTIEDYIHDIEAIMKIRTYAGQAIRLGYWLNKGLLYVDASLVVNDVIEAVNIANMSNQLAIFDFSTLEDITLREDHDAKIPQYEVTTITSTYAHAEVEDVDGVIEIEVNKYGDILFNGEVAKIIKVKYIPIIKVLQQLINRHRDAKVYTNGEYVGRVNEFGELY